MRQRWTSCSLTAARAWQTSWRRRRPLLTSANSTIGRETSATTRDMASVDTQQAAMGKALYAQSHALAALYTRQAQAQPGHVSSLFDMLA